MQQQNRLHIQSHLMKDPSLLKRFSFHHTQLDRYFELLSMIPTKDFNQILYQGMYRCIKVQIQRKLRKQWKKNSKQNSRRNAPSSFLQISLFLPKCIPDLQEKSQLLDRSQGRNYSCRIPFNTHLGIYCIEIFFKKITYLFFTSEPFDISFTATTAMINPSTGWNWKG